MKKKYQFLSVVINLLGIALVPANLFWIYAPEYVTIIFAVLMVAAFILYIVKGNGKRRSKILLGVFTLLSASITLFGAYCNPYWNSIVFKGYFYSKDYNYVLTYEEAKEDLDYFMHYLEKDHPMFFEGMPKEVEEKYQQAVEELANANQINVTMLHQKMQNIASTLKDAHTYSHGYYEDVFYLKWIPSQREKGQRLIKVEGMELAQLLEQKSDLYCYELESWGIMRMKQDLSDPQGMYFLGMDLEKGVSYTFEDKEGNEETVLYTTEDFVTWEEYVAFNQIEDNESENEPFVYYTIDKEKSLAVLTLESCNYNKEYRNCLKEFFTEVKAQKIENVAVDIRDNGGGNSLVVNEFMKYLDVDSYKTETSEWRLGFFNLTLGDGITENNKYSDLTFTGNLYCLTSQGSFSSAMMFAEYIKANRLGTLIGEAPGNTPTSYGDIAVFRMPNSGIYVQMSTKRFYQADTEETENIVAPDVFCESEDAMEKLIQIIAPTDEK